MLKITLHDSARELRLKLEGKLSGPWVEELRQCWRTAASTTAGRRSVLDLDEVDFVCPEGESLLTEMHQQGVRLMAATPVTRAMVEEIRRHSRCATVEDKLAKVTDVSLHRPTIGPDSRAS
jgi:hypothetical protein